MQNENKQMEWFAGFTVHDLLDNPKSVQCYNLWLAFSRQCRSLFESEESEELSFLFSAVVAEAVGWFDEKVELGQGCLSLRTKECVPVLRFLALPNWHYGICESFFANPQREWRIWLLCAFCLMTPPRAYIHNSGWSIARYHLLLAISSCHSLDMTQISAVDFVIEAIATDHTPKKPPVFIVSGCFTERKDKIDSFVVVDVSQLE